MRYVIFMFFAIVPSLTFAVETPDTTLRVAFVTSQQVSPFEKSLLADHTEVLEFVN